jgi:hypothetical protein
MSGEAEWKDTTKYAVDCIRGAAWLTDLARNRSPEIRVDTDHALKLLADYEARARHIAQLEAENKRLREALAKVEAERDRIMTARGGVIDIIMPQARDGETWQEAMTRVIAERDQYKAAQLACEAIERVIAHMDPGAYGVAGDVDTELDDWRKAQPATPTDAARGE